MELGFRNVDELFGVSEKLPSFWDSHFWADNEVGCRTGRWGLGSFDGVY